MAVNKGVSEEVFLHITKCHMNAPFQRLLGLKITEIGSGEVIMELNPAEDLLNSYGIVHGGATAALCDTAMGMAVLSLGKSPTTVEMKLNYMAPAAAGETLRAAGKIIRSGRTLTIAEAEVFSGDKLIIKALGTYIDI